MESWKNLTGQLQSLWKQLGMPQRILLGAALLAILAVSGGMAFWNGQPEMRLLYGRLDPAEAGRITAVLDEQRVAYQLGAGGSSIMVPADKVYGLRLQLASKGLPKADGTGFEIFDKPAFGMSDFVQRANYVRAIQGELARTISQMEGIESARIMIVLPENRLVIDARRKATASVFLNVRLPGAIGPAAVSAIRFLVSNSVEGLQPRDVSIVDNHGTMLSEPDDESSVTSQISTQLQQRKNLERYFTDKLHSMFEAILGPGQVVVRVAAEVSTDAMTRTSEYYDPTGTVPTKITRKEDVTDSLSSTAGGIAGVVANTTTNVLTLGGASRTNPPVGARLTRRDISEDYLVSRVQTNLVQAPGAVRRISAAVFVNLRYEGTGASRRAVARPPDELRKLQVAAEKALGSSLLMAGQNEVVVEEIPFNEEVQQRQAARTDTDQLWDRGTEVARIVALLLTGGLVVFLLVRLLRRGSEELIAAGVPLSQMMPGAASGAGTDDTGLGSADRKRTVMDFDLDGQQPERVTVDVLKELVRTNPQRMTQAARAWLSAKSEESRG